MQIWWCHKGSLSGCSCSCSCNCSWSSSSSSSSCNCSSSSCCCGGGGGGDGGGGGGCRCCYHEVHSIPDFAQVTFPKTTRYGFLELACWCRRCRVPLQGVGAECFFRVLLSECCVQFGAGLLVQGSAVKVRCVLSSLGAWCCCREWLVSMAVWTLWCLMEIAFVP